MYVLVGYEIGVPIFLFFSEVLRLVLFVDIFEHLNIFNSSLPGRNINITTWVKINGVKKKLDLLLISIGKKKLVSFQQIQELMEDLGKNNMIKCEHGFTDIQFFLTCRNSSNRERKTLQY